MATFPKVPEHLSFPSEEHRVLALWESTNAFLRSIEQRKTPSGDNAYVFYDGPPFATGLPHYGHFVASTIKDVVGRYWAMRGKYVERRFGWDTHGLPIEMLVEKSLNLSGPTSIREYGIDKFNEACRAGVLKYTQEWETAIRRLGRWVDFENDYKTMDLPFMESVWWVFAQLWEKGLVYRGFRVMPYSWRLSTPLSNFEANMDYRSVQDPAVTIRFTLLDSNEVVLGWTTTPWTLPSNLAVAVGPQMTYVRAQKPGDNTVYIVAQERLLAVLGKEAKVLSTLTGQELVGKRYQPLFPGLHVENGARFSILPSDHVTASDGTGFVHLAPAYGEDDFQVCNKAGIELVDLVDEEGNFTKQLSLVAGLNFKEADPIIIRHLKEQGYLFHQSTVQHSYPFCWRSGTPLIYKAVPVWFVYVEVLRDKMVENNHNIHWVPEAVGDKRFGNWLKDAQDWSVSRNRFWGTPLPIWECQQCHERQCLSSVAELESLCGAKVTDLHSHYIDQLQWKCPSCTGTMKRVPEVFDCWFESGSMPVAQLHYPFENQEEFAKGFPAQFIAEGLDQTRGWFYTLLVLSTALFDAPPFKNVIVNGLVLAEDGSKMSKSKQNYPDPMKVLDTHGADALRAYLINSPVVRAEPLAFSENGVREVVRVVMLPLYHAWSFLVQYANIDGWQPKTDLAKAPPVLERPEIDRWMLSKLQSLLDTANTQMEGYYLYKVVPPMMDFIDDLTNWYIRRSRRRFWKNAQDDAAKLDKLSAYATLYEVLVTLSKALAPVLPFLTETMYQNLVVSLGLNASHEDSVHLCDYPTAHSAFIDKDLEQAVDVVRQVVTMGRALRETHKLKVRQPLRTLTVVTHEVALQRAIMQHSELIAGELNVKAVQVLSDDDTLATVTVGPNFKTLGPKAGKAMKAIAARIEQFGKTELAALQDGQALLVEGIEVGLADVAITRKARGDVVIVTQGSLVVALDTELTDELVFEGIARELVSRVQKMRKDKGFAVTDRIVLSAYSEDPQVQKAIETHQTYLMEEVLAEQVLQTPSAEQEVLDLEGRPAHVSITRI